MARRVGFGDSDNEAEANRPPMKQRLVAGVMLTIWLALWTYGIYFVATALTGEDAPDGVGTVFITIWLVVAVIGWFFGVRTLWRVIQGKPLRIGRRRGPDEKNPFREDGPGESGQGFDN